MTLHVMDVDFTLQGEIVNPSSVSITREFAGNGAFCICVQEREAQRAGVRTGRVIFPVENPQHAGIIECITREEGSERVTISGVMLSGLLKRRIALPDTDSDATFGYDRIIADAESVMKHYVEKNITAPVDEKRAMPCMVLEENRHRGRSGIPWSARFEPLDQLLAQIGAYADAGYEIVPDFLQKKFVFRYLPGRDRSGTSGQRVTFSLGMGNTQTVTYCVDVSREKTTAYVGGAGEDENRAIYAVGMEKKGLERSEVFVDAGSAQGTDELSYEGGRALEEYGPDIFLRCAVLDAGPLRFGRDWDVGDLVNVEGAGAKTNSRITRVTETMEDGRSRALTVTLGSAPKGVVQVIRELKSARVR